MSIGYPNTGRGNTTVPFPIGDAVFEKGMCWKGELAVVPNTESLAANKTIAANDPWVQYLTPTAARDVTMPATTVKAAYYIVNLATNAARILTIKDADANTIGTVGATQAALVVSDGTTWSISRFAAGTSPGAAWTQTYSTANRTVANPTATTLTDNGGGTADGTIASMAAATTLTDSTGQSGTHDDTLAATTVPGALTVTDGEGTNDGTIGAITDNATTIAAVQELAAKINAVLTLLGVMTQNQSDVAQKIIEIVAWQATVADNMKELSTQGNALVADDLDNRQSITALVDDNQAAGISG